MKNSFKLTDLWHSKTKQSAHKSKLTKATHQKDKLAQEDWAMSPEDALRVTYTGNK